MAGLRIVSDDDDLGCRNGLDGCNFYQIEQRSLNRASPGLSDMV